MNRFSLTLLFLGFSFHAFTLKEVVADPSLESLEKGVFSNRIVIGQSLCLTGAAAGRAIALKSGSELYLRHVNAEGGVHGRKIEVITYDDAYEPSRTAGNTAKLIEKDKVFALFGFYGTSTTKAAVPLVSRENIPLLASSSGAEFLRVPVNSNIFNVRVTYFDETEALVDFAVRKLGKKRIATFLQDDGFGTAGGEGTERALWRHGLKVIAEGRYQRKTGDLSAAFSSIRDANPDAVIIWAVGHPVSEFLKKARSAGLKAEFLTGSSAAIPELFASENREGVEGLYITSGVPLLSQHQFSLVRQYLQDTKDAGVGSDEASLEGYLNAQILVEGLKRAGKDLTRAKFRAALESVRNVNFGGVKVSFAPPFHQGLRKVFLTRIERGNVVPVR